VQVVTSTVLQTSTVLNDVEMLGLRPAQQTHFDHLLGLFYDYATVSEEHAARLRVVRHGLSTRSEQFGDQPCTRCVHVHTVIVSK